MREWVGGGVRGERESERRRRGEECGKMWRENTKTTTSSNIITHHTSQHMTQHKQKDKNNKQTTSRVEASHTQNKTSEGQRVEGGELKESLWGWWEMCGG